MSSRIFVRGLPPLMSEDDFRKHFSQGTSVTDVKLLPQRRIGYVGYASHEAALKAVKSFNKTFIRMSRLRVELAEASVGNLSKNRQMQSSRERPNGAAEIPQSDSLKRKRGADEPNAQEQEQHGYKHPKGVRTIRASTNKAVAIDEASLDCDVGGDGTYKIAVQGRSAQPDTELPGGIQGSEQSVTTKEAAEEATRDSEVKEQDLRTSPEAAGPLRSSSDVDWMRSRTSRLLDLVDNENDRGGYGGEEPIASETVPSNQLNHGQKASSIIYANDGDKVPITSDALDPPHKPLRLGMSDFEGQQKSSAREKIRQTCRLFLRNLPYSVTENDLEVLSNPYGHPQEVHIPRGFNSGESKGIGFIQFEDAESAARAFEGLDNTILQGRLLHVLPAEQKRESKLDDIAISKLPPKKQKQIQRKSEAMSSIFSWNSLFMNADAVISSTAARMGVSKSELLDPTSSEAAVKQAQTETHVIREAKNFFQEHGVNLEAFSKGDRDGHAILVKNFKFDTSADNLKDLFARYGDVTQVLMPPSGTIAIVELANKVQAGAAFGALAYRKHKDSVLFLERAPRELFKEHRHPPEEHRNVIKDPKFAGDDAAQGQQGDHQVDTTTLYVRNISFATTRQRFEELFQNLDGFLSATIKTKPDPKHEGEVLSMGFGFVEFRTSSQAKASFFAMNGFNLDGHELVLRASNKGLDAAAERRKEKAAGKKENRNSKIIIKNLPFEASKKDVRSLFKSYGQLRAVRVPKKFDNSRKGFAFAEFTSPREAEHAMDALKNTHLLGRRLVLEYAAVDADDPEEEIQKMQQRVEKQSDKVALQRISKNRRKKLNIGNPTDFDP